MHVDISRDTYRSRNAYISVLAQQGRPLLDSETNEEAAIQVSADRAFARDVIGQHGGPGGGFTIGYVKQTEGTKASLTIAPGRYYVDGIPVDATRFAPWPVVPEPSDGAEGAAAQGNPPTQWGYWDQPYAFRDVDRVEDDLPNLPFLVYLRVYDRLVTAVQDPRLLETALGAALPDTTARVRVDWDVLAMQLDLGNAQPADAFSKWVQGRQGVQRSMAAQAQRPPRVEDDPCVIAPSAQYRGPENQYYRVQIHRGGDATTATFKWSRDNGSIVFPVTEIDGDWVTLSRLGRDDILDLGVGGYVEVADDPYDGRGDINDLLQILEIDVLGRRVRLSTEPDTHVGKIAAHHPYLRRWDHAQSRRRGAPKIVGGAISMTEGQWLDIEQGVQVWFGQGGTYVPGDYWRFAARTISGDVEWPVDDAGHALLLPPDGVQYHYAPLAWIDAKGTLTALRKTFKPLTGL
jgi:hypothetical protein